MTTNQETTRPPDCVTCGRELENSDIGGAWLTEDYWDCECDEKYIHGKTEASCSRCGMNELEDGMPDSHVLEVIKYIHRPQCRECQRLPSGLRALMETAGVTGAAEREMRAFLLARLSGEDYADAVKLIHVYRRMCLRVRDLILLENGSKIPPEHRMTYRRAAASDTETMLSSAFVAPSRDAAGPDFAGEIEAQRDAAMEGPSEWFDQDAESRPSS